MSSTRDQMETQSNCGISLWLNMGAIDQNSQERIVPRVGEPNMEDAHSTPICRVGQTLNAKPLTPVNFEKKLNAITQNLFLIDHKNIFLQNLPSTEQFAYHWMFFQQTQAYSISSGNIQKSLTAEIDQKAKKRNANQVNAWTKVMSSSVFWHLFDRQRFKKLSKRGLPWSWL